jgi:predicted permease
MRTGVSTIQAKADLDVIVQRLATAYPAERRAIAVELLPGMRILNIGMDRYLAAALSPVLLGFALVLVVACLNVANLLLARGVARQHEIGVRLVLGAGRGRLVRQLFAENLLLCGMGAGAALLLALWTLRALKPILVSMLSTEPKAQAFISMIDIGLDGRIVGFGALLAVVAGLTAGLAPALHAVRRDGVFALKNEGTAFGRKLTQSRLRGFLLVGQVAVCLTLLAVCGMMSGKLLRIRANGTGFVTDGVYLATPAARTGAATALSRDPLGAIETLRTLPGVASACLVGAIPLGKPGDNVRSVAIKVAEAKTRISYNRVSAGFFDSFGVSVVRGRAFTTQETASGAPVVIISESAAKRLWPGQEALGKVLAVEDTLFVQRTSADTAEPVLAYRECAVVGVSRDFLSNWGGTQDKDIMLLPVPPMGATGSILMRLSSDSLATRRTVEESALAAGLPIKLQDSLDTLVDRGLWPYRAFASISGALTGLALLLATVGLYGVVSFGVNQRTREIGVRMALGATAERVTGFFVRQGMRLVASGIGFGLLGGTAFAVLLDKVMPGADFAGPVAFRCIVFAVVTMLLSVVALVACWLPARRAAKVDPMVALRTE